MKTAEELLTTGRILVWDIETTDFKANFGHMLMWAGKFIGEDHVHYARIDDSSFFKQGDPTTMIDDSEIVQAIVELVDSADAIVHHYGDRFDLRFVNTRALVNGIIPPHPPTTIDTWKVARSNLAMTSNRLATLAETFCSEDNQKSGLSKDQWKLAGMGHRPTLDKMLDYCIQDVMSTEELYLALRPVIRNHPYIGPSGTREDRRLQCPTCGSMSTVGHGVRRTKCFEVSRRRCTNCGSAFESGRRKIA
jgi:DNA polymerase elongation subunit (family B)